MVCRQVTMAVVVTAGILCSSGCACHPFRCFRPPVAVAAAPPAPCGNGCGPAISVPSYYRPQLIPQAPAVSSFGPAPLPPAPAAAIGPWRSMPGTVRPNGIPVQPGPAPESNGQGNGTRLLPPDSGNGARVLPPTVDDPPPAPTPPAPPAPIPPAPPPSSIQGGVDASEFPPDIRQFNLVYDNVAAGLQPFVGGFTWLKQRGYRTVLHIRPKGEENAAARKEIEELGLKYLSLEISPQTLTRELVQEFGRIVRDTQGYPLFVYDAKGMAAGTLWFVHFRLTDNQAEEEARRRAVRLGLKEDTTGEAAEWWLAINQLLREK